MVLKRTTTITTTEFLKNQNATTTNRQIDVKYKINSQKQRPPINRLKPYYGRIQQEQVQRQRHTTNDAGKIKKNRGSGGRTRGSFGKKNQQPQTQ